jgi:hypothetical protein
MKLRPLGMFEFSAVEVEGDGVRLLRVSTNVIQISHVVEAGDSYCKVVMSNGGEFIANMGYDMFVRKVRDYLRYNEQYIIMN